MIKKKKSFQAFEWMLITCSARWPWELSALQTKMLLENEETTKKRDKNFEKNNKQSNIVKIKA